MELLDEIHADLPATRSAVKSLMRQARHVSQLLAALDEQLDHLEIRAAQGGKANDPTQGTQNQHAHDGR